LFIFRSGVPLVNSLYYAIRLCDTLYPDCVLNNISVGGIDRDVVALIVEQQYRHEKKLIFYIIPRRPALVIALIDDDSEKEEEDVASSTHF